MRFRKVLTVAAGLAAFWLAPGLCAQTLADIAREAKQKGQNSSRRVYTNDDLRSGIPAIRLLRETVNPPSLAPYEPTSMPLVEAMLQFAGVRRDELVFDIGSGDGRIVIMAAEIFGARGVGIEIDSGLVARSRKTIEEKGLTERVRIIHANALDVDLSSADVVTLYLTPDGIDQLRPHLEATLRSGTRVVCNAFPVKEWTPTRVERLENHMVYLYYVP